jgi:hypothetical protein
MCEFSEGKTIHRVLDEKFYVRDERSVDNWRLALFFIDGQTKRAFS